MKPTIPQVLPLLQLHAKWKNDGACCGCFHCYLDDGNIGKRFVNEVDISHPFCSMISELLTKMSNSQLRRILKKI